MSLVLSPEFFFFAGLGRTVNATPLSDRWRLSSFPFFRMITGLLSPPLPSSSHYPHHPLCFLLLELSFFSNFSLGLFFFSPDAVIPLLLAIRGITGKFFERKSLPWLFFPFPASVLPLSCL